MENKDSGLTDNLAGLLSYFGIPAIAFLVMDPYKTKPFIRFHAFQALIMWGLILCIDIVISMVSMVVPFLVVLVWPIIGLFDLAVLATGVFCMYKAFNNETFSLPVLGDLAKKQAG